MSVASPGLGNVGEGGLVWIASYPKSGNTWMRLSIAAALAGGVLKDINRYAHKGFYASARSWFERHGDVELADLMPAEVERLRPRLWEAAAAKTERPILVKIHDQRRTPSGVDLIPPAVTRAIVYLVRDPRDLAISWAHHSGSDLDECIAGMADPEHGMIRDPKGITLQLPQWMGTWSDHCRSWIDAGSPEALVLRYEDRLVDPAGTLKSVIDAARLGISDAVIAKAIETTSFERLRGFEDASGFAERTREATRSFFGEGKSGGWRSILTKAQAARIEADHGEMMARLNYL